VSGFVRDAQNGDPIPFAAVAVKGTGSGANTDFEGHYKIQFSAGDSLSVSFIGYKRNTKVLDKLAPVQAIDFSLNSSANQLSEILIRPGENPAWPIMRAVMENKKKNDRNDLGAYQYQSYTRTEIDIANISGKLKKNPVTRNLSRTLDASKKIEADSGRMVLPVFVSESVSEFYRNTKLNKTKEVISKSKVTGVGLADNSLLNQMLGQSFLDLNFYNNTIPIVSKDFVSPLTEAWRLNYHYYLADSLDLGGHFCYVLQFVPKNKHDLVFAGKMWIDKVTYALVQIDATVGKYANINYVDKIKIQQEFTPTAGNAWLALNTRILVSVNGSSEKYSGLLGRTYIHNSGIKINEPMPPSFYEIPLETADDTKAADSVWQQVRPIPLSEQEQEVYKMIDSVKNIPSVKSWITTIDFIASGYKTFGKFELGPYLYTYAFNAFEGHRLRLGFRTDQEFSKIYNLKGYVALSTDDNWPFKFNLDASRILSRKRLTEVGIKGGFEAEQLGVNSEELSFNTNLATALFSAFARFGRFDRPFYEASAEAYLSTELSPGFTQRLSCSHRTFSPVFNFPTDYKTSELVYEVRYSKGEYAQLSKRNKRIKMKRRKGAPAYTFKYIFGAQALGGDFNYHKFSGSISNTFHLGLIGRSTLTLYGGFTPSHLPFTLLYLHQGNESPIYIASAYNMMDFCEFVSDRYASLHLFHDFEGLFFNRIPLINKLGWRCHVTGKALWGTLGQGNQALLPYYSPSSADYHDISFLNPQTPYAEAGYGVDNIFKCLRIDFLHRLTYLDTKAMNNFSIKFSISIKL
jgi:hypothetical protein